MAGDGPAQNNLGVLYRDGHGVAHDSIQAAYWFAQSAASGYKEGMKNYATALERGDGVEWIMMKLCIGETKVRTINGGY